MRHAVRSEVENSPVLKEEADAVVLKTGEVVDVHDVSAAGEMPGAGEPQPDCDCPPNCDWYGHPDQPPEDEEPVPPGVDAGSA